MRKLSCIVALFVLYVSSALCQNVQYSYDALGRLAGVIDQNGNAAQYIYDANGNILAVMRFSSSQVGILSFSPVAGPPGTSVTITGINLVSIQGSTAVGFSGATAGAPTSASANQIVIQVPSGASTGPISVTNSIGTANSATVFTVTDPALGPQITGISPVVSSGGGGPIMLTGLNFATPATSDLLSVNQVAIPASTASSTQIGLNLPSQLGSGHIALSTALGSATSAGDLYVAPPPYTPSQVTSYLRLALGTPAASSPVNPGDIAMLLFDGGQGNKASILLQNATFPGGCWSSIVSIIAPNGSAGPQAQLCGQGTGFLDAFALTQPGTYAAVIAPQNGGVGSADVTAYEFNDVLENLVSGATEAVSLSTPGQNANLSFTGTAGDTVNIWLSQISISACFSMNFRLIAPNGTRINSTDLCSQNSGGFSEVVLPLSGTYLAIADPYGPLTGSFSASLSHDISGYLNTGVSQQITLTIPGQRPATPLTLVRVIGAVFYLQTRHSPEDAGR